MALRANEVSQQGVPIIIAASEYAECKKWAKACNFDEELFHFGGKKLNIFLTTKVTNKNNAKTLKKDM